jgi:hypothetical protein
MGKIAFASFVGTAIEFYDSYIYGTAAALVLGSSMQPLSLVKPPGRRDPKAKPRDEGEAPARLLRLGNRPACYWPRSSSGLAHDRGERH